MNIDDINSSNKKRVPWLKANGYYDFIMDNTSQLPETSSVGERIYFLQSRLTTRPTCKTCGGIVAYDTSRRYSEFCSQGCRNSSRTSFDLDACIERYNAGEGMLGIAADYKISNVTLKKRLVDAGVTIRLHDENQKLQYHKNRNQMFPEIDFQKLDDLDWIMEQNKTRSIQEIAEEIGVKAPTIFKNLPDGYDSIIHYSSLPEKRIHALLDEYGIKYESNTKSLINPFEIDIYLPDHNIAIEVNGAYWHSQLNGKTRTYHLKKTDMCEKLGINLIHIWDYEITDNWEIVKSRILNKVGKSSHVIYGRKCVIADVDKKIAAAFLKDNHIDGNVKCTTALGLYHNGILVAVMTFSQARFTKADWEILRFASLLNHNVIGGVSKLLKHFRKTNLGSVVSYADRRWTCKNDAVYEKIGGRLQNVSGPNYKYTQDYQSFESRNVYQKHKLARRLKIFDSKLTEWDNMQANGFDRIWDCGNLVFMWD